MPDAGCLAMRIYGTQCLFVVGRCNCAITIVIIWRAHMIYIWLE